VYRADLAPSSEFGTSAHGVLVSFAVATCFMAREVAGSQLFTLEWFSDMVDMSVLSLYRLAMVPATSGRLSFGFI
jgi:hypothetical protein